MPSKSFEEQEAQATKDQNHREGESAVQEVNDETEYYWAPSGKCQIANFEEEEWSGSRMTKREKPLRFAEHVYAARTEKERKFLRASNAFKNGHIHLCKDLAEAYAKTAQHNALKGIKEIKCESISNSMITERSDGKFAETRQPDEVKFSSPALGK